MQKLLIVFVVGVVVGGGVAAFVRLPPPPAVQDMERPWEEQLQQSEAEVKRLTADIELLREDRLLFETYEFESSSLLSEQATDGAPVNHTENTGLYYPVNEITEIDSMTEAADQTFRNRLHAEANGVYRLLVNNPGQPEGRRYLKQARDTYIRAGSPNQAIKMQEELLQRYPEPDPYHQLAELASLENTVGEQDEAISVLNDAINTTPSTINKLNGMRRVARYKEKRYGPEAGLTAWRELDQYANSIGKEGSKPARKARSKIEQLERTLGLRP